MEVQNGERPKFKEPTFYTNSPKDDFNHNTAFFKVLKGMNFGISIQEGATDAYGKPLPDDFKIIVEESQINKIAKISELFDQTPEQKLFFLADIGIPGDIIGEFVVEKTIKTIKKGGVHQETIDSWINENNILIKRALKLAYLRRADKGREEDRQSAEAINEKALDPEGIRAVVDITVRKILDQHLELKPTP